MTIYQTISKSQFRIFAVLCCFTGLVHGQNKEADLDAVMSAWAGLDSPGAAVSYLENGEVVLQKAYGVANLEHSIPWTIDTVSDLGSVSKQFTGFAFALLAEQGKLSLDDDIRLHLPELPDLGDTITIRHLFNHTSGLREIYNTLYLVNRRPGDIIFQEDAQKLVGYQRELQFTPGSRYLYNNTEYMLLADIVEAVTGEEFHDWMESNIFNPLDMNDTVIMHQQGQVIPKVATSYSTREDTYVQIYDNSTLQGGGGIYSTVEDMSKWIANFSSLRVGTESTLEILTESGVLNNGESLDYGLGIGVNNLNGVLRWSHSGSSAGYRSMLVYLPEHARGYIFQTSTPANGIPVAELNQALMGDVLQPVKQNESGVAPSTEIISVPVDNPSVFTGRYFSDELETFYRVALDEEQLAMSHRWLGSFSLQHRGDDEFDFVGRGGSAHFHRDGEGNVTGFTLDNGRTIGVKFRRFD